jgi:hypothetical protein
MFGENLFGETIAPEQHGSTLAENWDYPPFSVFNARDGWWQERKRQWLTLGIKSELGRDDGVLFPNQDHLNSIMDQRKGVNGKPVNVAPGGSPRPLDRMKAARAANGKPVDPTPRGTSGAMGSVKQIDFYRDQKSAEGLTFGELPNYDGADRHISGTSIFDPVICELMYRWFCPKDGTVLDPFAGGSVRGIVAAKLGFKYVGMDLRKEQVEANREQWLAIGPILGDVPEPTWLAGNSKTDLPDIQADFVFTCPPYGDLEVYSDLPGDLSGMHHCDFLVAYHRIIDAAASRLKNDRFACFVVGDFRDDKGNYRNFLGSTIDGFEWAEMQLYNEAILVTAVGSLPIRTGRQFASGRKLGKTHQNILVFVKGDGKMAARVMNGQKELAL